MFNGIIFYSSFILIILFGFLTIWFKNIFYSLLSAIVVFFLTAALFYLLGSEYNAIIQLAIYGFAVPVILGIAIMFTNMNNNSLKKESNSKYLLFLICGLFILALVYLIMTSYAVVPDGFMDNPSEISNAFDNISVFSRGIFVKYVWGFELISLILTIIIAGITVILRKERIGRK